MKSEWKIAIEKIGETVSTRIFEAKVSDNGKEYIFKVDVDKDYSDKLFGINVPLLLIVQQSFMFLLEKEPVTAILRDFNLKEIAEYFPEYENTMKEIFQHE